MTDPVVQLNLTVDVEGRAAPALEGGFARTGQPLTEPKASDVRLFIERDETSGVYIYKTLDRVTGEVLSQFPREEVLRVMKSPDYVPGTIFDAKS
ncbi:flagellar protein FlaG [Caulobacter sp. NIBR2454]|uniref:flagellar protein FlaG n=1 Tax=Caulobacter sp. NIBR2454 TaxID=3015996 RepID=UPI0022B60CFD|nr:flagellar protein FlaG [Caulobacter sp. NIBR2454]